METTHHHPFTTHAATSAPPCQPPWVNEPFQPPNTSPTISLALISRLSKPWPPLFTTWQPLQFRTLYNSRIHACFHKLTIKMNPTSKLCSSQALEEKERSLSYLEVKLSKRGVLDSSPKFSKVFGSYQAILTHFEFLVMSTSTHLIIILSDSDVEDAFSSTNAPDYTSASPDYSPASPGNTSSDPSEDSSKDRSASLAISPFHDDPYMKVMQAYNATSNESHMPLPRAPITPPPILPSSPLLPPSPLFDPRDFFLPEEIMPPQKRACFLSSSSTDSSPLPQVFEVGESSHVTRLERHEEQIDAILNHLDELPLERIEHMEDRDRSLVNGRNNSYSEILDQLETELQRKQMRHDDEIVLARVRIATLEMLIEDIQVRHRSYMKSLLDMIHELKNHKGGPPDY
ncbi:hypothetical protein Tco_0351232 [Tanacetum coccineum]